MKAIIFGTGKLCISLKHLVAGKAEVVAFVDNDPLRQGCMIDGKPIVSIGELGSIEYDSVFTASIYQKDMFDQLIEYGVDVNKVHSIYELFDLRDSLEEYQRDTAVLLNNAIKNRIETKYSKVYVACKAFQKSGGPELLHQMVYMLNSIGVLAYIAYYDIDTNNSTGNPAYEKYVHDKTMSLEDVEDSENSIIVFPETAVEKHLMFKRAKKILWFLSVDYYAMLTPKDRWAEIIEPFDYFFSQSVYGILFLRMLSVHQDRVFYLSDYLSDVYLNCRIEHDSEIREDIVLYNPQKGLPFTKKLISQAGKIRFVPIENMTDRQIVDISSKSKVYIDFGNHPGKDRLPRETALMGCCVITGRRGSAANDIDVNIPEEYKFNEQQGSIPQIIDKINQCLREYDCCSRDFEEYRKIIRHEKESFIESLKHIFAV